MPANQQGNLDQRYKYVPRVLIFATRGDSVLLIKGAESKRLWPGLYNGVGGHIERGESISGAARREFFEETGLDLLDQVLKAVITIDVEAGVGVSLYVFTGTAAGGTTTASGEGSVEFIPIQDVNRLPLVADLYELLPRILARRTDDPPWIGHFSYDNNGELKMHFEP
jgi:8-oxo-dGTP diphosphatase